MTPGRAALIALVNRYLGGLLDPFVSLLEVHKLMYFMQEAGEPLRLDFQAKQYGPYATNLRQVLARLERHYTQGYGDGQDAPETQIELLPGAVEQAEEFLAQHQETHRRMDRVVALIDGFEDAYGMELLSSAHWVMRHEPNCCADPDAAVAAVQRWNARKRRHLKPDHLRKAWQRLTEKGWPVPARA